MKFVNKIFIATLVVLLLVGVNACKKSDSGTSTTPSSTATTTVNSTTSGRITNSAGFAIEVPQGSVPPNVNGQAANLAFSIESPITSPQSLQAGASAKGDVVRFGPDNFTLRWPVRIWLPVPTSVTDLSILHIMWFDPSASVWKIVPTSAIDGTNKKFGADVMNLGIYTLATISSMSKNLATDSEGGFEYTGTSGYYYTLTVYTVSSWKFPSQAAWYSDLTTRPASVGSGSTPTGGPDNLPVHFSLPQATYSIWVSRTQPGTLSTLPVIQTYSLPATGTLSGPLTYSWTGTTGYTTLSLPGGGSWVNGSPGSWGTPTSTYGTGDFQATLTWTNTTAVHADVDLHLYCKFTNSTGAADSLHVYWADQTSSDNNFQLDRDWRNQIGAAVENIYSLQPPASWKHGAYTIKVNYWGSSASPEPSSIPFNVRVLRNGSVKNVTSSVGPTNQWVTIDSWTY